MQMRPVSFASTTLALAAIAIAATVCLFVAGPVGWIWIGIVLALTAAGLILPAANVLAVSMTVSPQPPTLSQGDTVNLMLSVRNRCPWPATGLVLRWKDQTIPLASVRFGRSILHADCDTFKRGVYEAKSMVVACGFPFNFVEIRRGVTNGTLVVWPRTIPIGRLVAEAAASDGGDRLRNADIGETGGLRAYQRGDPPRQIAWAATARLGRIVARQQVIASGQHWRVVFDEAAFDRDGGGDCFAYELALRALASLAAAAVVAKQCVVFDVDGSSSAVQDSVSLQRLLNLVADLPARPRREACVVRPVEASAVLVLTSACGQDHRGSLMLRFGTPGSPDPRVVCSESELDARLSALGVTQGRVHAR